jgi:hypothetical protein
MRPSVKIRNAIYEDCTTKFDICPVNLCKGKSAYRIKSINIRAVSYDALMFLVPLTFTFSSLMQ